MPPKKRTRAEATSNYSNDAASQTDPPAKRLRRGTAKGAVAAAQSNPRAKRLRSGKTRGSVATPQRGGATTRGATHSEATTPAEQEEERRLNRVFRLKVQLQNECRRLGLATDGVKQALINRIILHNRGRTNDDGNDSPDHESSRASSQSSEDILESHPELHADRAPDRETPELPAQDLRETDERPPPDYETLEFSLLPDYETPEASGRNPVNRPPWRRPRRRDQLYTAGEMFEVLMYRSRETLLGLCRNANLSLDGGKAELAGRILDWRYSGLFDRLLPGLLFRRLDLNSEDGSSDNISINIGPNSHDTETAPTVEFHPDIDRETLLEPHEVFEMPHGRFIYLRSDSSRHSIPIAVVENGSKRYVNHIELRNLRPNAPWWAFHDITQCFLCRYLDVPPAENVRQLPGGGLAYFSIQNIPEIPTRVDADEGRA